jgi:hypothetical protein
MLRFLHLGDECIKADEAIEWADNEVWLAQHGIVMTIWSVRFCSNIVYHCQCGDLLITTVTSDWKAAGATSHASNWIKWRCSKYVKTSQFLSLCLTAYPLSSLLETTE